MNLDSFVYVDTETTGLDPFTHDVVEVAWAVGDGMIREAVVPHTLDGADPQALKVNGYFERDLDIVAAMNTDKLPALFLRDLRGRHVVGSNPAFDATFLRKKLGVAVWHYRLVNVVDMAAALFGWPVPKGLAAVTAQLRELGYEIAEPDHTAARDVKVARDAHRALLEISTNPVVRDVVQSQLFGAVDDAEEGAA